MRHWTTLKAEHKNQKESAQINLKIMQQSWQTDKRVFLSKRSVQGLLRALEKMIEDEIKTAKKKLTFGSTVKHRLKESGSAEEYNGETSKKTVS